MMGKTHEVIGSAAWLGVLAAVPALGHQWYVAVGGAFIAYVAALGPDIDHPRATATRLLGPITKGINKLLLAIGVKHRGFTHSFAATALVASAMFSCVVYLHLVPWIAMAVVIGWLSHSLIDSIGKRKVQFLWPMKGGFCMNLVSADSWIENYLIFPLAIIACAVFTTILIVRFLSHVPDSVYGE
jgi:membrane-bound metal-dependent hydrolase YbcI (DUF457 family)